MRVGAEETPRSWNPPLESTVNRLLPPVHGPVSKINCFRTLASWEAAIKAKLALSPTAKDAGTVKLNWTGLPQSLVWPVRASVQIVPEVEEPVTTQLVPLSVIVTNWLTA